MNDKDLGQVIDSEFSIKDDKKPSHSIIVIWCFLTYLGLWVWLRKGNVALKLLLHIGGIVFDVIRDRK